MSYDLASRLKGFLLRTGPVFMPDRWSAPRLLTFMMTYRCNLRCTMCWQWGEQGLFHDLTKDHEIQQLDLATLRSVIDVKGQRVSALDRLYLLSSMPTMIVWGERDNTIPLAHGLEAQRQIPGSRFETLPRAAHFPHLEDPEGLAAVLRDFLETSEPAPMDDADWGGVILSRSAPRRQAVEERAA